MYIICSVIIGIFILLGFIIGSDHDRIKVRDELIASLERTIKATDAQLRMEKAAYRKAEATIGKLRAEITKLKANTNFI